MCVCVERLKLPSEPKRNCCSVCCCKVTRSWNATFNSRFGGNTLSATFSSPSASSSRSFRVLNVFHPCVSWQRTAGTSSSMSRTHSLMFKSNVPMLSGPDVVLPPNERSCPCSPFFFGVPCSHVCSVWCFASCKGQTFSHFCSDGTKWQAVECCGHSLRVITVPCQMPWRQEQVLRYCTNFALRHKLHIFLRIFTIK